MSSTIGLLRRVERVDHLLVNFGHRGVVVEGEAGGGGSPIISSVDDPV